MNSSNTAKPDDDLSRLDRIARTVPCGLYEYDLDANGRSHFPYFNEKMLEIFAVTAEELAADASIIWQPFHPDDREMVHQADFRLSVTSQQITFECDG
jgi:PAS domain-containing protein